VIYPKLIVLQKKYVAALVAVTSIAVITILMAVHSNQNEEKKFINFFVEVLAPEKPTHFKLNRLPSDLSVCVYGNEMARTKKWVESFFEIVRRETWISPKIHFEKGTANCSSDTFLYVFFHRGQKSALSTVVGDLSFILNRYGLNDFNSNYDNYGFGKIIYNKGKEPRAYAAINEDINIAEYLNEDISRNVIQKLLFQILLAVPDKKINRKPKSIIEERDFPGSSIDTDSLSVDSMGERFKLNVPNMCLYDIMLMKIVYAKDQSILNGTLENYIKYIKFNYKNILKSSSEVQNNPRYRDIFKNNC
jgi:hypothetical protein